MVKQKGKRANGRNIFGETTTMMILITLSINFVKQWGVKVVTINGSRFRENLGTFFRKTKEVLELNLHADGIRITIDYDVLLEGWGRCKIF